MEASPNMEPKPPVLGIVFANSTTDLPAAAADSTDFWSTLPFTSLENSAIPLPNTTSFSPNLSQSLLPKKSPNKPPLFGIVFANSVIILPHDVATSVDF